MKHQDLSSFDPEADFSIVERALPHWSQAGTICFVTWRLADSLPRDVRRRLDAEVSQLLARNDLAASNLTEQLAARTRRERGRFKWKLFQIRDKFLDAGHGECWLRRPACARIVLKSLLHFDEDRYFLTDAVVMPNHVHFLCAFKEEDAMLKQCEDWKRFSAREINRVVGRNGGFWQIDQFDHLVRSADQFDHYRRYIRDNSRSAGLPDGESCYLSKKISRVT